MSGLQICTLGASTLDPGTGALLTQCKGAPLSDDPADAEDFGEIPIACALGLVAMPFPANDTGAAQGIVAPVPGLDGVVIAARDTRTAKVVGNMRPGDTVVHSTGPNQAAQLQLKETKRQAVLATKGSDGRQVIVMLDGANDKIQILGFGCMIQLNKEDGCMLTSETGAASIQLKGDTISLTGTVVLGGRTPVAPILMGPSPGVPVPGVFAGK